MLSSIRSDCTKPKGAEKARVYTVDPGGIPSLERGAPPAHSVCIVSEVEIERASWDPKDGELCLSRTKSEETLMEVRSDSDVQIDRPTWV